ncbi:ATP-binding cassette domain-containing protein [Oerskovia sp. M15]
MLGPNGAGKSSLLGALTGDLPLDDGKILVDNAPCVPGRPPSSRCAGPCSCSRSS